MVNIFEYFDYRKYLLDSYLAIKRQKSHFSYRYIAGRVGLNPGYIVKVFTGKVHLGANNIDAFAELLELAGKEREYFEELVHFGRAKNENEIEQRFERLTAIKGVEFTTLTDKNIEFFRQWYHMAVRSLISIYPFDGRHFRRLGALLSPPISARQTRESIVLLEKLGLVRKGSDGIYRVSEQFVSTGDTWMSPVITEYQKKTMELAIESLKRHKKSLRDISTVTMTFSQKDMPALREKIRQFRHELLMMSQDIAHEDCVMQLNIQMFPCALLPGEDE